METWTDILGYEGLYQISNYGNIKSHYKEPPIYLTKSINIYGYYRVSLYKNKIMKIFYIHRLVWDIFGNKKRDGRKLQIDHIDGNKLNNNIENLQLLTNRENITKGYKKKRGLSTGVHIQKYKNNISFIAQIHINGKGKYLGCFKTEKDASEAYLKAKEKFINTNKKERE